MCGRYALFTEEENQGIREIMNELNERYKEDIAKMKTGEIFPTNYSPVITANEQGRIVYNLFKWGFPNFRQPSGVIINARSETIREKPTFRKLVNTSRCLIPASGFYEWKASDNTKKKKEKYIIRTSENALMYMAGLYSNCFDKNGLPFTGFVIITTEANEEMSTIHNRMPVILNKPEGSLWIKTKSKEINDIKSILRPYNDKLLIEKVI